MTNAIQAIKQRGVDGVIKTLEISKKQAICKHYFNIITNKCEICGITEKRWHLLAEAQTIKTLRKNG